MRIVPPLIVSEAEIAEGIRRLDAASSAVEERLAVAIDRPDA